MDENSLIERAGAWQRAIETRDATAAAELLHQDYALQLVHPEPAVVPRARWLATLEEYIVHAYEIDERVVDVDGDTAAVLQRIRQQATVMGEDRSGQFVITDVWRLVDGTWRVWRRHSTPFTAPRMPGVD